jgi:hypothetical protein
MTELLPPPAAPDPGLVRQLAAGFLIELRADPERGALGIGLTMKDNPAGSGRDPWADLAMQLSEHPGPVSPEDPDAPSHCDFCGNSDQAELVPGPDGPAWPQRACRDDLLDDCLARRERRYPPDLERVPLFIFEAALAQREAAQHGAVIQLAADRAARQYIAELSAMPDEPVMLTASEAPAAAWSSQAQAPAYNPWHHAISGSAHKRRHLISGGHTWPGQLYPAGESQGLGTDVPTGAGHPGTEEHALQHEQGPGAPMDVPRRRSSPWPQYGKRPARLPGARRRRAR